MVQEWRMEVLEGDDDRRGLGEARKIRASNVGDEVAAQLRDLIFAGYLAPDERLRLRDVADWLGVSTTPVREALLTLAKEGLVQWSHHRGFQVGSLSLSDIEDTFELHAFIAGILAERATSLLSREEISELGGLDQKVQKAIEDGQPEDVEEYNYQFHRRINKRTDSHILKRFLGETTRYVPRRFYLQIPGWLDATAHDHAAIFSAIKKGDPGSARSAMEAHIRAAGALLVVHLVGTGRWPAVGSPPSSPRQPSRTT